MRLRVAQLVLCVGTTLLLLSILVWWNFTLLLSGEAQGSGSGSTYMVIGKQITERNMGNAAANSFSEQEIAGLLHAPQVQDAGAVTPALFPAYAVIGGRLAMSTDLPLESVPDRFLDEVPADWRWQPGDRNLPVILSSRFFDIYNYVFAPGQGLPQLSRQSVKSIGIKLQIGGDSGESLSAHVSGFSDRIGSVLVPESFIAYGNATFPLKGVSRNPSQLILKVGDPSDSRFTNYLEQQGYTADPQNLRWSRMRAVVEAVTAATGLLALLLMSISAIVFVLFIELTIARGRASLLLLKQLGYSAAYLRGFMLRQFLPGVAVTMLLSLFLCISVQVIASKQAIANGLVLPLLPGVPVWTAFSLCVVALCLFMAKTIGNMIKA